MITLTLSWSIPCGIESGKEGCTNICKRGDSFLLISLMWNILRIYYTRHISFSLKGAVLYMYYYTEEILIWQNCLWQLFSEAMEKLIKLIAWSFSSGPLVVDEKECVTISDCDFCIHIGVMCVGNKWNHNIICGTNEHEFRMCVLNIRPLSSI